MNRTLITLLAPAKDAEVGIAAIDHGADAVYIGGPAFGAREKVANSIADIERLCRHAALFDAKVLVTLNTLLYDNELERARQIAWDCWNAGADALIVQDMSLLQLDLPPIPLHASTQCDNMTVEKVQELESLGFSQVVLGRELSLEEIRLIRQQTKVPLEFFIHGSLCVSRSGRCYLSQHIGNRSANRGACAQPCRLPWDLLDANGKVLIEGRHLLCLKDLNNSDHLEELMDAGVTCFKIEGRLKEADYVKNVTAFYRQKLDAIFERRPEYAQASQGHCGAMPFEVNPEKSFNRGFTDYFINGRQQGIDSPFTPKSMGEFVGEVAWCNSVQMELKTDKVLHNGDGLCFLNGKGELVGIRADVVKGNVVSCNRPHGVQRGYRIYRNYDIEWQRQVESSKGSRKLDMVIILSETPDGFALTSHLSLFNFQFSISSSHVPATNPEKALQNIRKKALQWGDTVFRPVSLELQFSQPYLIPASVIGELKRGLVTNMMGALVEDHRSRRERRDDRGEASLISDGVSKISDGFPEVVRIDPDDVPNRLMTCKHCIRFANGACLRHPRTDAPKALLEASQPWYIRHGENTFRLEFDCAHCVMNIYYD